MPTVVGVKLKGQAKPEMFNTGDAEVSSDVVVVVTTERGTEIGRVVSEPEEMAPDKAPSVQKVVERVATADDLKRAEELERKEREAMPVFRRMIAEHELDMKAVDVEYAFDESKMVFYFAAEERVDFRDLVRDLSAEFHSRIDMRQIGVRDEARMIGGLGHCGEPLCCVRFGGEFQPVSIRMAKEQDLPLNPLKISGLCGRLMCCLRYEYDAYKDFKGRAPKKNAQVQVGEETGKVVDLNTPRETVTVRVEGRSLTFPLADMECGKGAECPCKVSDEAVERMTAGTRSPIAEMATVTRGKSGEPKLRQAKAVPAPAKDEGGGERAKAPSTRRRRRRRGGAQAAAATGQQAPQEQKKSGAVASASGQPAEKAGEQAKAPRPAGGRRRRRRRSGGGTGPAPAGGEAPSQQ